jgi:DNA polymerase V
MDVEQAFASGYRGTKSFSQWDVQTANATGFGAAADDYMERGIDLNEALVNNKASTFFMRVNSDAMTDAGIHQGDVVIIDRSLKPLNGKIIIAALDGELLIRRMEKTFNKLFLHAASAKFPSTEVDASSQQFSVWGVVTYVIHAV